MTTTATATTTAATITRLATAGRIQSVTPDSKGPGGVTSNGAA